MQTITNQPAIPPLDSHTRVTSPSSGYSLRSGGGIQVILPEQGRVLGPATLLSPTSVWAVSDEEVDPLSLEWPLQVCLDTGSSAIGPVWGQLQGTAVVGGGKGALGIQLLDVTAEQGWRILSLLEEELRRGGASPESSPLAVQEEIVGEERRVSVLRMIAAMGNAAVVRRPGQRARVLLERVALEEGRLYWRGLESLAGWNEPTRDLEVVGYNSAFRMRLETLESEGERWVTRLPERLWRVRHRWHRRVVAPRGLRARFSHPLWAELGTRERDVVDVSYSGLSLRSGDEDLLFPGLFLPLELETARGERIRMRCEVRHVSFSQTDGRRLCGLEARPQEPRDAALWTQLVSQTLSPATRTSEELLAPLWDLYSASGYFNLAGKSTESFTQLREDFLDLGARMVALPHLFCQTVWPSARGVEASLSSLKPYQHAWMIHQLGRRPGKPENAPAVPGQILRDVYQRTLEHAQGDASFRWLFCYAEATVPWMQRTHLRFAERVRDPGGALCMNLRLMDVACAELSGEPAGGLEVGPATLGEKQQLVWELARTRPASYVEALDFTRDRLDLRDPARAWSDGGLQRERRILVARRDGEPLAALVLELGQPGTNLFRLLDSARLFPLAPGAQQAYVALLDEARRWFAQRGRSAFTYLCEDEGAYAERARLHDDPTTRPFLWILPASLVPEFLEHIQEQSVGRPRSSSLSPPQP
jgi:hypothetical protein